MRDATFFPLEPVTAQELCRGIVLRGDYPRSDGLVFWKVHQPPNWMGDVEQERTPIHTGGNGRQPFFGCAVFRPPGKVALSGRVTADAISFQMVLAAMTSTRRVLELVVPVLVELHRPKLASRLMMGRSYRSFSGDLQWHKT